MNILKIDINKLLPHPDNPRSDVGDVSELAESIRNSGLMQNLTVVKNDDDTYTVIIGHRRLAAAKLIGLKELTCQVVKMSKQEQATTMLLENMQRTDLTLGEQCFGVQTCMNLGLSLEDISKKTGFSKETIKKRSKVAKYGKKIIDKGNVTLDDLLKLEKIENEEDKNKLIEKLGTDNFNWSFNSILQKQNQRKEREKIKNYCQEIGIEIVKNTENLRYERYVENLESLKEKLIPMKEIYKNDDIKIYLNSFSAAEIYVVRSQKDEKAKQERDENRKRYECLIDNFNEVQKLFEEHLSNTVIDDSMLLKILFFNSLANSNSFYEFCKVNIDNNFKECFNAIKNLNRNQLKKYVLDLLEFDYLSYLCNWNGNYIADNKAMAVIGMMEALDYKFSDEEKALLYGSSKLYRKV